MNLDQLEAFELVAQLGSLSKAAKASAVAQSLISRKLAQLEAEWGDRLFHRTGRGVVLSEFGMRIRPHIQLMLAQAEQLRNEVKDAAGVPIGTVHLGVLPSISRELTTALFSRVRASAPGVRLRITEGFSGNLDEQLASGRLDIAVINRYGQSTPAGEEALGRIDTYVIGAAGNADLAGQKFPFTDLKGKLLVLPPAPNGLRSALDHIARQKGFSLDVAIEVDTLAAMKEVAASGEALTILPFPAVVQEVAAGILRAARLVQPGIPRTVTLCITKQRPLTRAGRFVLAELRELVPELLVRTTR
ncbi:LysR substrate-binding domain-containing protein [Noviherbaspirillum denitrificans]|uniref:LysR family transcriptional regulator n=1 Tax=Noviherbaspirillum denitrificans TaxID=1968433 RepID=A0A254TQJ1_9BURK|nr:LysR substrate-binding domain-containing protein [Noviherbaspirillum denitrificans]OWW22923.1 LysR family transcriptional regulator [Noviherbaspirillum denitrificans]